MDISVKKRLHIGFMVLSEIIVACLSLHPIFYLNENQLLYISSTSAQIVAGFFGLTITGYIFLSEKLGTDSENDESLADIIDQLKVEYRSQLIFIGIVVFGSVVCSLTSIALGIEKISTIGFVGNFILSNSVFLAVCAVAFIISFVLVVIDPQKISRASDATKRRLDNSGGNDSHVKDEGNLADFLKTYNEIERMLAEKVFAIMGKDYQNRNQVSMYQNLKILVSTGVIEKNLYDEIDYLRRYRNSIVHGLDMSVSQKACDTANHIRDELNHTK
jgi:hypothetical protein